MTLTGGISRSWPGAPKADPGTSAQVICGHYDSNGVNQRAWFFRFNNNVLEFIYDTTGSGGTNLSSSAFNPVGSTWYHLAVARAGNTLRFFVNGVVTGTAALSGTIFAPSAPFQIGAISGNSGYTNFFNGSIADVRLTVGHDINPGQV